MILAQHTIALAIGFALDLVFGDPHWLPHPIRWIGHLISGTEKLARKVYGSTKTGQRIGGTVMALFVLAVSTGLACLVLYLCTLASPWLALIVESIICYQMLATKSLRDESMKVHDALETGSLEEARSAVSMIVGRDTERLDEAGVTRAAVETVAENASDGVIAPLLFMALGGAPLGVFYKAANTMDSMVGYKNDRYRYFGTFAAHLDDVLNFLPARLAGLLMCAAAWFTHLSARGAWRIWRRDHAKHASPNSAHTEAACAGALGLQLAGNSYYFGKLVVKPTIGDATRAIEPKDIVRANRLMYATALLGLAVSLAFSFLIYLIGGIPAWA